MTDGQAPKIQGDEGCNARGQREADNLIKRGARIYKAKWLEEKCIEVEDGLRHHNMKKAYCLKKTLKKGS